MKTVLIVLALPALSLKGLYNFFFSSSSDRSPTSLFPENRPQMNEFLTTGPDLKAIWFGHSTFLLNYGGKIVLVDPVFSNAASPVKFMVQRFQAPVLKLEELPEVDYIVLSHDHYDHLDKETMQFFKDKKTEFLTPLGVGSYLRGWGIESARITELDWWQSHSAGGLEFVATPAQHFSGRDGIHDGSTLWASWVIKNETHKIYFSGDSGYDTHFEEIGKRFGPFDVAFMEVGQYNETWKEVHLLPEEAAQAYFDLRAKRFIPVHWGMFVLALHTWYDPIERIHQLSGARGIHLLTPKLGELMIINDLYKSEVWWKNLFSLKSIGGP